MSWPALFMALFMHSSNPITPLSHTNARSWRIGGTNGREDRLQGLSWQIGVSLVSWVADYAV